jgi:C2 domain
MPALRKTPLLASEFTHVSRGTVNFVRGIKLAAMDSDGTSDPYIKYKLVDAHGNVLLRDHTHTVSNTLNPLWMYQCQFAAPDLFGGRYSLRVKVYDKDRFKDDHMGHATLTLSGMCLGIVVGRLFCLVMRVSLRRSIGLLVCVCLVLACEPAREVTSHKEGYY